MPEKNNFYITTTLPYVNAEPHIGFALEIVTADVLARFHRSLGEEVIFNTGTDEHGQKIFTAATATGQSPQNYVDGYAAKFRQLSTLLNLSVTNFVRTTDTHHLSAAQYRVRRFLLARSGQRRCVDRGRGLHGARRLRRVDLDDRANLVE